VELVPPLAKKSRQSEKIGLVLQGGGARGAYQVGALKAIAEITGCRKSPFPIVSGASVGAINAGPLAAAASNFCHGVAKLERLWRGLHCHDIYETRPSAIASTTARWLWSIAAGGLGLGDPGSLLDNRPLEKLLRRNFKRERIAKAIQDGTLDALCITASSYERGEAITFIESRDGIEGWERVRRKGVHAEVGVDHLLASSALPFVFRAKNIDGSYLGDGALRLTVPLSPAIRCGAEKLLIIGVRDNKPGRGENTNPETYPSIGDMSGHALDIIFNDNLDADCERLQRINKTLALIPKAGRSKIGLRQIDYMMLQPSEDLRDIAADHANEMPKTIQLLLKSVGAWGEDARLVSYLLFESGYIGTLIDLGYRDAMARSGELRDFLGDYTD